MSAVSEMWRERREEVDEAAGDLEKLQELRATYSRLTVDYLMGREGMPADVKEARRYGALAGRAQERIDDWCAAVDARRAQGL